MQDHNENPVKTIAVASLIAVVVLLLDYAIELGVAVGAAYIFVVWRGAELERSRAIWIAASLCSVLIFVGFIISPVGGVTWKVLLNRVLDLAMVWIMAYLLYKQKQIRSELKSSEERSLLILDSALDAVVVTDSRGILLGWNPQAELTFGYSRDEAIGQPIDRLIIPERYRERFALNLLHFLKTGHDERLERRMELSAVRKNGEEFPVEFSISPLLKGNTYEFSAFIRDISSQREAEETRSHLSAIIESCNDAIIGKSLDGYITSWNRGAEVLYGYSAEDMMGEHIARIVPPDRMDEVDDILRRIRAGEVIEQFETIRTRKDGRHVYVLVTISPIHNADGSVIGASVIAHDISKRKKMEKQLLSKNDALAASNKELEQFAFIASHDLKEPLRKIQAFGKLLSTGEYGTLDDKGREFLDYMLDAAERMQDLLVSLLGYSRITSRAKPFGQVDLNEVLEDVKSDMEITISSAEARIEADQLPTVSADQAQMRQLFQNLISNSIKYKKENERPEINITSTLSDDGEECRLQFKDNGIGFDQKYAEQVFEVFKRLHGRGKYEGTGMGLSICRKIVERHHGCISVTSEPGQGAEFVIVLPVKQ